ncbi:hypothetical protein [Streptomyces litchfieldiae]|uniref:Integral membrane protein n=1 Tax=Streptomyces litchfieldiae TaxID=3075543 RepID=A0ABU2MLL4_9ACTN|nr:hypothetical protein [Streptomyces sp. DSM 44938]MDT0342375.1 hypothetical protein [Streptomyces sp. DSM 44938]
MSRLLSSWRHRVAERLHGRYSDRGAGFVEYAGLLLLIAAVVGAVMALDLHEAISDAIGDAVADVLGSSEE